MNRDLSPYRVEIADIKRAGETLWDAERAVKIAVAIQAVIDDCEPPATVVDQGIELFWAAWRGEGVVRSRKELGE